MPLLRVNCVQEVLDQRRDVLAALAQRRHGQVDDVQAVEQVLAERALGDHVAQVAVRRGDDADVDASHRAVGADLLQLAGFQEPQQQALHAQRHLADFVEEDGAAVGHLELARLVAIGAGEAALDVAEQLRLEQRFGQAGAVDGDDGARGARAALVDGVGDELLADAALAGDKHLGVGTRDALDLLRELGNRRAAADQFSASLASHSRFSVLGSRFWFLVLFAGFTQELFETATALLVHTDKHRSERRLRIAACSIDNALHLNVGGERRGAHAGLQVRPRPDRQVRLTRQQRARQTDIDEPDPRPYLELALERPIHGDARVLGDAQPSSVPEQLLPPLSPRLPVLLTVRSPSRLRFARLVTA